MSSLYPGALDNLADAPASPSMTPLGGSTPTHSEHHQALADAIDAVQATLGTNPQGGSATVDARLDALDTTVAGKEASGTAASAVSAHEAAGDPHPQYTTAAEASSAASSAVSTHTAASDPHGDRAYADAAVATHAAASDPHTGYQRESEKDAANGYAGLDANARLALTKLASIATASFLGRTSASTGVVEELTATQATALLNAFTSALKGLVPASGGGTTNFLRADGSWAAPPGGGGLTDGDYGDVVASAGGTVLTIDAGAVSTSKMGGDVTTAGKALLDDADASAQLTTLGVSAFIKTLVDDADATAARTTLGAAASTHAAQHQHGGADEVATATPAANAIPKAGSDSRLAYGWLDPVDMADALHLWGEGTDTDVTITTVVTLTRDMDYNNLTIGTGGQLLTAGFRVRVKGTLTVTTATSPAITYAAAASGNGGAGATAGTAGTAGTALAGNQLGGSGSAGAAGGAGGTTTGTAAGAPSTASQGIGGTGGTSGAGGLGASGAGGAGGAGSTATRNADRHLTPFVDIQFGATLPNGGGGGRGGGGGGGDGTAGGGGGGGGAGGAIIEIYARSIDLTSAPSIVIQADGKTGGNGGSATAGNRGGGGGGAGGGGGVVRLVVGYFTGPGTRTISADGGAGGAGGNGFGTGVGGAGGGGGTGGHVSIHRLFLGDVLRAQGGAGTAGGAASGTTAGTSGPGGSCRVNTL